MAKLLELAQFVDQHGVTQMQIRRSGIKPGLDPQRLAALQLLLQLCRQQQLFHAAPQLQHLFGHCSHRVLFRLSRHARAHNCSRMERHSVDLRCAAQLRFRDDFRPRQASSSYEAVCHARPAAGIGGGGGDSHVLVLQQGSCQLYELFVGRRARGGRCLTPGFEAKVACTRARAGAGGRGYRWFVHLASFRYGFVATSVVPRC